MTDAPGNRCPIRLENDHWICSVGTCDICQEDLRKQVGLRDKTITALQSQLALAREALKPFAEHLTYLENDGDYPPLREGPMEMYVDIRDLRRARDTLAKLMD